MLADFLDKCGHILILDNSLRASLFCAFELAQAWLGRGGKSPWPARPPAGLSVTLPHTLCVRRPPVGCGGGGEAEGSNRLSSASVAVSFLCGPTERSAVVSP